MNGSSQRSLGDYLHVLRERRLIVFGAIFVALAVGTISIALSTPSYTSTAVVAFQDTSAALSLVGIPATSDPNPDKTAAQNAQRVVELPVAEHVRAALHLQTSPTALLGQVTSQVDPASDLVDVAATSGDAQMAAAIANGFALETQKEAADAERSRLVGAAAELRARMRHLKSSVQKASDADQLSRLQTLEALVQPVTIQQRAAVPKTATSPRPVRDVLLAGILGLLIGVAAAFLRDAFDRKIREPTELEKEYGLPLIGYVGEQALGQARVARNGNGFGDLDYEAFRIIRSNVSLLTIDSPLTTVAVTSAVAEEGKSTVALWYAHANAVAGRRTLLVECDLRRPVLATRTELHAQPGIVDYLVGESEPAEVIQTISLGGDDDEDSWDRRHGHSTNGAEPATNRSIPLGTFACIAAGSPSIRPAELLGSARFRSFLREVGEAYDLVVLDTSPLLPVGDTLELLPQVHAVLLCARIGLLTPEHVRGAKLSMEHFPHKSSGLVVTGLKRHGTDYYGYYGGYRPNVGATA